MNTKMYRLYIYVYIYNVNKRRLPLNVRWLVEGYDTKF